MSEPKDSKSVQYVESDFSTLNAHADGVINNEEQLSRLKRFKADRARIKNIGIIALIIGVLAILLAYAYSRTQVPIIEIVEKPVYIDKPVYHTIKVPDPELSKIIEVPIYIEKIIKVPIQIIKREGGVTDFSFFNKIKIGKNGIAEVWVGASYKDVNSPYPEKQWCYAYGSKSASKNTTPQIDLANKKGLSRPIFYKITQEDATAFGSTVSALKSAQSSCDFFPDKPPIEDGESSTIQPQEPYPEEPPELGGKSGSGFYVNSNGYVVTNHHVIENCSSVWINDKGKDISGIVLKKNKNLDIAVIKINTSSSNYAKFADKVRTGEDVMALGFPLGETLGAEIKVTKGNISAMSGIKGDSEYLQFTAPIQAGNSGGPLLNYGGFIVGINTANLRGEEYQNINFAIKGNSAQRFLGKNGIKFESGAYDEPLESPDLAEKGEKFTVRVLCFM